ncbi:MAG: phosphate ABC transporter permease PstA [Verrucomicrobiales bacterium]|nr:phosphate ABC transporter permease PstA [Verrucomicrobiales bacterium]
MKIGRTGDTLLGAFCAVAALTGVGALIWIITDLIQLGLPHLSPGFLTGEVTESGRGGGIGPILVSTVLILISCLTFAVPIGVGCALWFAEIIPEKSHVGKLLSASIDLLASVPSIVFGLFGMVFFCQILGLGFSILAGGLTLACMILPIVIRTTIAAMQAIPEDLRPAAAALGLSRSTTLGKILLPRALPGVIVGITISVARALSETAALIFTSGYATRWPESLGDSGRSVSVHIYDLAMNIPNGAARASASALVLLILILVINLAASFFSDRWFARQSATHSAIHG